MDAQSVLVLAAELGVGLAGFSSISAALVSTGSHEQSRFRRARVNTLVFSSLGVVLFAYVPMVLALAMPDSSAPWRISSAAYGLWHCLSLLEHLRSIRSFREQPDFSMLQVWFAASAFSLSILLNLYNVSVAGTSWPFLASLACGLSVAGSRFAQLVRSLWPSDDSAG